MNRAQELLARVLAGNPAVLVENAATLRSRNLVRAQILAGVEWIEGRACRQAVQHAGLRQLHRFFPRRRLPRLCEYLNYQVSKNVLQMAKDLCRQEFGLGKEFFIEAVVVYRIHFPFGSRDSVPSDKAPRRGFREQLKRAYYDVVLSAQSTRPWLSPWLLGYARPTFSKPYEDGHAPHRDYWFGYSLSTLNLWWAIEEVDEDNGMVLFPDTSGKRLGWRQEGSPYLAEGEPLPQPHYTPLRAGEILAFNTHDLHGTRLNETQQTRIVVSIRVTPKEPRFFRPAAAAVRGAFHPASRLDKGDFRTLWNPGDHSEAEMWGEPEECARNVPPVPTVEIDASWPSEQRLRLFEENLLTTSGRVLVKLRDRELLVFSASPEPVALDSRCPHAGYALTDGYCDAESVHCPGHGVRFDLRSGQSACNLNVNRYPCRRVENSIYLEPRAR